MLRTLLTTTALTAMLSVGAIAQDAATKAPAAETTAAAAGSSILAQGYNAVDSDNLATKIIGREVYSSTAADAEHIGDVNDLVVNQDGSIAAAVIGVGGFLGVGEKNVAVNFQDLQFTTAADNTERYVLPTTKDALNAAPEFKWRDDHPANAAANNNANNNNNMAAAPAANNNMAAAPADQNAAQPINPSGFTDVTLTADELKGTTAYGPNNENLGKIGDVLLADDGKTVDAVIIDFGGFLGIGAKPVAVGFDALKFQQDQNNNRYVFLNVTREQLDNAVAFNKDTYKSDPNQRLAVQG